MRQDITVRLEGLVAGRGAESLTPPIDLRLGCGEALIVTGENGAGKSTLLRTLAGLVAPISGSARIEGALAADGEPARTLAEAAHYLGHRNALKGGESVAANLRFWHRYLRGPDETETVLEAALAAVGLAGLGPITLAHLSAGQQRRVALARLLLAPRAVWLLDEPTGALDAAARERFSAIATEHLHDGGILVATTHHPLGIEGRALVLERPHAAILT